MPALRVLVVGAGVIGSAVALRLAQAGARVALVDGGGPCSGTSGTSFAWVNAGAKRPRPYYELNLAGMVAHRRLAAEVGHASWYVAAGNLQWAADDAGRRELDELAFELMDWGYPLRHLTTAQVVRDLEPDLRIPGTVSEVLFFSDEAHIVPCALVEALLAAARSLGATVITGAPVVGFRTAGPRVTGVVLGNGGEIAADVVVCCCGRWTNDVLGLVDRRVPMAPYDEMGSPAIGLLVRTGPGAPGLGRVLHPPGLAIRPAGGGRLLLYSERADRQVLPGGPISPSVVREVMERCAEVLPGLAGVAPESAAVGVRPLPADGCSVVGWMPGVGGLYVMVTHSGVTLAAVLGELAAAEVVRGEDQSLLAAFRPNRFEG